MVFRHVLCRTQLASLDWRNLWICYLQLHCTDLYFPPALYEKLLNVQHDLEDLKELLPMKKGVLKSFQITPMQDVTETF